MKANVYLLRVPKEGIRRMEEAIIEEIMGPNFLK